MAYRSFETNKLWNINLVWNVQGVFYLYQLTATQLPKSKLSGGQTTCLYILFIYRCVFEECFCFCCFFFLKITQKTVQDDILVSNRHRRIYMTYQGRQTMKQD